MTMSLTPSIMGNLSANLIITFTGLGSPLTIPLQGTGGNPLPTITSVSPPSVYVGSPAVTLTVNGTGFVPGSLVYFSFQSISLATTYVSSTQLTAQIPASELTTTFSGPVYVIKCAAGRREFTIGDV